jgi:hypothetical protein
MESMMEQIARWENEGDTTLPLGMKAGPPLAAVDSTSLPAGSPTDRKDDRIADHDFLTWARKHKEWKDLCLRNHWVCRVCGAYSAYMNDPRGYEEGYCPAHRLDSEQE